MTPFSVCSVGAFWRAAISLRATRMVISTARPWYIRSPTISWIRFHFRPGSIELSPLGRDSCVESRISFLVLDVVNLVGDWGRGD